MPRPTGRCRSGSSRSTARVRRWTRSSRGPAPRSARRTRRAPASASASQPRRGRRSIDDRRPASPSRRHDDSCERFQYGNSSQSVLPHALEQRRRRQATIRYLDFDQSHCRAARISGKIVTSDSEDRIVAVAAGGVGARLLPRAHRQDIDRELTRRRAAAPSCYRVNGDGAAVRRRGPPLVRRAPAARPRRGVDQRRAARAALALAGRSRRRAAAHRRPAELGRQALALQRAARRPALRAELDGLVKQAGRSIPSSGDLRSVLSKAAAQQNRARVSPSTLEDAIGAVPSSGDLTSVLIAFGQTDDREQLLAVARTALKIPSSGDLSRFLVEVAPRYLGRDDAALRDAYFKAVANIPSSGDLARVLVNATPFAAKSRGDRAGRDRGGGHGAVVGRPLARARLARRVGRGARCSAPRCLPEGRLGDRRRPTDMRRALEALTGN